VKENRESNKFAYKVGIIKSTEKGPSKDTYGHEFFDLNSVQALNRKENQGSGKSCNNGNDHIMPLGSLIIQEEVLDIVWGAEE
jgi:hypothetical protein